MHFQNMKHILIAFSILFSAFASYAQAGGDAPCDGPNRNTFLNPAPQIIPFTPRSWTPPPGPFTNPDTSRFVFWTHGLGGNLLSWADVSAATEDYVPGWDTIGYSARKVRSRRPSLGGNDFDLHVTASYFREYAEAQTSAQDPDHWKENIIIAHSQGGLVSRWLDMVYDRPENEGQKRYGGIVTFGSSHQGARIINNAVPDPVTGKSLAIEMVEDACRNLGDGPIAEKVESSFWLDLLLNYDDVDRRVDTFCTNTLGQGIASIMFKDFTQPITQEYKVGAPEIGILNEHSASSNLPKVAMYGIEDEPVLWRTMHYLQNNPNGEEYFDAVHDSLGVAYYEKNKAKYLGRFHAWNYIGAFHTWIMIDLAQGWINQNDFCNGLGLPNNCLDNISQEDAITIRNAWRRGYWWWRDANDKFKIINGSTSFDTTTAMVCKCYSCTPLQQGEEDCTEWSFWGEDCEALSLTFSYCVNVPEVSINKVEKPSDGIVLAESAGDYPGAKPVLLQGSNHQQMRNDRNTKNELNKLWEGDHGLFFRTQPK